MALDRAYVGRNEASRARLRAVVAALSEADVRVPTEETGWNVGQLLGHLAFSDRFVAVRWRAALDAGRTGPEALPEGLSELINPALAPIFERFVAAAPAAVGEEALSAAAAADALLAGLTDASVGGLAADSRLLDRSLHRLEHLGQIGRAVAGGDPNDA